MGQPESTSQTRLEEGAKWGITAPASVQYDVWSVQAAGAGQRAAARVGGRWSRADETRTSTQVPKYQVPLNTYTEFQSLHVSLQQERLTKIYSTELVTI